MENYFVAIASAIISLAAGFWVGRKAGIAEGFRRQAKRIRFEKRERVAIDPTDQPHSAKPRGRSRVSDAHVSQVRRHWNE